MKLSPHLRSAYQRWSTWAQANKRKPLNDMPSWYLVAMTALPGFVVALGTPMLGQATPLYADQLLPVAPWQLSAAMGIWLLAWWTMVGMCALMTATHGRVLGERLFNSPPTSD